VKSSEESQIFLCNANEIPQGGAKKVVLHGIEILLLRLGEQIHAIEPICTHHGTDLTSGLVNTRAATIRCPLHGAVFDVITGTPLMGPFGCEGDILPWLRVYRTALRGGAVLLDRRQEWGEI
jgi:nitrite reductase/ring-hydroxylating ferredoxin subunit